MLKLLIIKALGLLLIVSCGKQTKNIETKSSVKKLDREAKNLEYADRQNLKRLIDTGDINTLSSLLKKGRFSLLDKIYHNGKLVYPIHYATKKCARNTRKVLSFILQNYPDNAYITNENDDSALMIATQNNKTSCMRTLIRSKQLENIDETNAQKKTALEFAIQNNRYYPIISLLKAGASFDYRTSLGINVIDFATQQQRPLAIRDIFIDLKNIVLLKQYDQLTGLFKRSSQNKNWDTFEIITKNLDPSTITMSDASIEEFMQYGYYNTKQFKNLLTFIDLEKMNGVFVNYFTKYTTIHALNEFLKELKFQPNINYINRHSKSTIQNALDRDRNEIIYKVLEYKPNTYLACKKLSHPKRQRRKYLRSLLKCHLATP